VRRCPYQEFDQHTLAANEKLLGHGLMIVRKGSASAFFDDGRENDAWRNSRPNL
jgi:hypothetical protein